MATKKTKTTAETKEAAVAPATEFDPSGAPVQTVADVDPEDPAVDANPRENTTEDQNRIDFNDPALSGSDAVENNLKQGK
jgi:hypothetical protein